MFIFMLLEGILSLALTVGSVLKAHKPRIYEDLAFVGKRPGPTSLKGLLKRCFKGCLWRTSIICGAAVCALVVIVSTLLELRVVDAVSQQGLRQLWVSPPRGSHKKLTSRTCLLMPVASRAFLSL